jgi:hypothetical protein
MWYVLNLIIDTDVFIYGLTVMEEVWHVDKKVGCVICNKIKFISTIGCFVGTVQFSKSVL